MMNPTWEELGSNCRSQKLRKILRWEVSNYCTACVGSVNSLPPSAEYMLSQCWVIVD